MLTSSLSIYRAIASIMTGVVLSSLPAMGATAQAAPGSVKLRNDCRLAIQVLTTGHPGPQTDDALTTIGLCGPEGYTALFKAWNNDGFSEKEFGLLVTSTRAVVNPRLVDAMFEVAGSEGFSTTHRVAALLVLTTYADPYRVPWFHDLIGSSEQLRGTRFGHVDHPYSGSGRETLTAPVMPRLLQFLARLEDSDANPEMRTAAHVLISNLE